MRKIEIAPEVMDVLNKSTITATSVTLPPGNLSRDLYVAVNKVLEAAGGKWSKKDKAHVFQEDPRPVLGVALETGTVAKLVTEKQEYQAFFTPKELAQYMVMRADVEGKTVLEPSAGDGALADACKVAGAKRVDCIELNPRYVDRLAKKGHNVTPGDFLAVEPRPIYDRVVMNPPFTKNQDIKHVEHALKCVRPGGAVVAIMASNTDRKWFKELKHMRTIEQIGDGAFKESGTNVNTVLVTIYV